MITVKHKGNLKNTYNFLNDSTKINIYSKLNALGKEGVEALSKATPIESGKTASSWAYEIVNNKGQYKVTWTNTNIVNGVMIAVLLQYGYGRQDGVYVSGRDYINPAMKPLFDNVTNSLWKEVTK